MNKAAPWSIKGVDFDVREAAKEAARRDGVTLGEWMNRAIVDRAAELGANAQEFDADERLEAVAAQLARLSQDASREPGPETAPQRRRGEAERRPESRIPVGRERAPAARLPEGLDWASDFNRDGPERRRGAPERRAGRGAANEQPVRREFEDIRRGRSVRDNADAEALLEQAVAAFEEQAGRVETRAARALANVAKLIEASEDDRAEALAQVGARLADLEQKLQRGDKEAIKPLRGMISSVHDRLGEIETRLSRKDRSVDDRSLRGALERLESRIEAMSRQTDESADDSHLRQLDSHLAAILSRLDKVEMSPPGAARDEQFARLEKRFDALMARLDRPKFEQSAPRPASVVALKGGVEGAISQIAAHQRDLDSGSRPARPPAPQLTALLDEKFEALARKFDLAAAKTSASDADRTDIDRLQNGIEALSDRVETMRREFTASGAQSRAALEQFARELASRVEAALAAPQAAGLQELDSLRRDIAVLSRNIAEAAPRSMVAGLENALRELSERVEASRDAMIRAAEARREPTSSAEIHALSEKVAAMGRSLGEVAPRAAAAIEQATRELAERMEASRDAMILAAQARPEPTPSAEIDALSAKVAAMGHTLADLAPRSQVASLESAVRALTARIERSRDEGIRDAVLAPIETLADDVRRALAEAGASANFDGVSRQLREVEDKIEQLRALGGGDRSDFLQVYDQSEQIRAMIAEAMEKIAPIERLENQVGVLSERLEDIARQTREASSAQISLPWNEIEARLNDLASRIDRAATPAPVDDARFDDLVRRLDNLHETLAARIENEQSAMRDREPASDLEPLLRLLSAKLEAEPASQLAVFNDSIANRIAEISQRLERGDSESERRLHCAIEEMSARLESMRDPEREDRNAREIADLRERTESSDRRAQETLSAVHETLEKVVDRLALLEEDVIEARGAVEAAGRSAAPQPAPVAIDSDAFLMEPGAGRPSEVAAARRPRAPAPVVADLDDDDPALGLEEPKRAGPADPKPAHSSYIDIARRALAARVAVEKAEQEEKDKKKRASVALNAAAAAVGDKARFVRPLAAGEKGMNRRLPAVLVAGVSVLTLAAYGAHRIFESPTPPMQAVFAPQAEKPAVPSPAPAPAQPEAKTNAAAPIAPPAEAPAASAPSPAPESAPAAPLNSAPILPGNVIAPRTEKGASLPDPLTTGSIGARPNTMAAIQAGAQNQALKDLAEKGDAVAQYDYAARLADGRGVAQDQAGAVAWFEKAATQGLPQAQYRLGAIYEKGVGTARDPKKAADWYQKAANQGHIRAMHNLAVVLAEGVDGKPDYNAAAQWFRRAAEYGVRDSQFNLAILYARGMGAPQNLSQSYVWFAVAALQGDVDAAKKRDEIGERLDAASLDKAKKQVADFHARTPLASVNDAPTPATSSAASVAPRKAASVRKI